MSKRAAMKRVGGYRPTYRLLPAGYPFKWRAGDVFKFCDRLCRVIRVHYSSAVVIMSRPVRKFKTRFDKPVMFQPPPQQFYISPNSEVAILNRKAKQ